MNRVQGNERPDKGESLLKALKDYTVIDIETTGLSPQWDDIIEVAATRVRGGKEVAKWESLVNIDYSLDDFLVELTGITDEMLAGAPTLAEVLPKYIKFIGDDVVVGHNVNFDVNFIYDNAARLGMPAFGNDYVDTMRMSRRLQPELEHHRLGDVAEKLGMRRDALHRSQSDVDITNECYKRLLEKTETCPDWDAKRMTRRQGGVKASELSANINEFNEDSPIYGMAFVFTGALDRMPRKDAMQIVLDMGGKCQDGVNKETNYLVIGNKGYSMELREGKSAKRIKAEKMALDGKDISIISEDVFYDMLTQTDEARFPVGKKKIDEVWNGLAEKRREVLMAIRRIIIEEGGAPTLMRYNVFDTSMDVICAGVVAKIYTGVKGDYMKLNNAYTETPDGADISPAPKIYMAKRRARMDSAEDAERMRGAIKVGLQEAMRYYERYSPEEIIERNGNYYSVLREYPIE